MKDRNELKKEVAGRLREIRKKLGIKQLEISSRLDTGRANYSRVENGESFPNLNILYTLCTEFEICLNWLIAGSGSMIIRREEKNDLERPLDKIDAEVELLIEEMNRSPRLYHLVMELYYRDKAEQKFAANRIASVRHEILQ